MLLVPLFGLKGRVVGIDWAVCGSPRLRKEFVATWESLRLEMAGMMGVVDRENLVCGLFP